MSDINLQQPVFEKIHPDTFYQYVFYNPDVDIYLTFSEDQLEMARVIEYQDIFSDLGHDVLDYPAVYHIKKQAQHDKMIFNPYTGDLKLVEDNPVYYNGMSFRNADPEADFHKVIMLREEDVAEKQVLGQMFLANGRLATRSDYEDRRDSVFSDLMNNQSADRLRYVLKRPPVDYRAG